MDKEDQSSLFGGHGSPAAVVSGAALIVLASGRIVSALVCTMALLWTNSLTIGVSGALRAFFPFPAPERGASPASGIVFAFLASWAAFLFYFVLSLINPFMAAESVFFIALCPVFLSFRDFSAKLPGTDTIDLLLQAVSQVLVTGVLILAAALIREPLGSGTFSFPGFELTRWTATSPLSILQTSAGVFILLGYVLALYRRFKTDRAPDGPGKEP